MLPAKNMSRPVTMNDLFAEPEGEESSGPSGKIGEKLRRLDGMNTKSKITIEKTAKQGEFGAKKFIKP